MDDAERFFGVLVFENCLFKDRYFEDRSFENRSVKIFFDDRFSKTVFLMNKINPNP